MIAGLLFDRAPRRVYWEVTRACDLACRHCRAEATPDPDPRELTSAEGLWLLDRLAACEPPAPHVVLTGGDPLKRSDLFLLIERATALGLPVSVAPSGTPRLTGEVIRLLRAAGVEAISLSLDGSDAASHDALRGVPGCFERTVAAARAAAAERLPFQVNTLVSQETFDDLPAIWAATADLGAARWSLFFLVTVGRGSVLRPISAEACERLLGWLADRSSDGGPVIGTTEAPHFRRVLLERARRAARRDGAADRGGAGHAAGIRDGNGIMFVSHTGDVTPSGFMPLPQGNVRTADPVTIYRDAPLFRALRQADRFEGRCGRCQFRGPCGGSRARAFAASGNPLGEDPLCLHEPPSP
jgi:radical SAM protein